MGCLRLFRRVRIASGLTVNLSKSGPSLSLGACGAHVTVSRRGLRKTVGMRGTGVFYTSRRGWHSGVHTGEAFGHASPAARGSMNSNATGWLLLLLLALAFWLWLEHASRAGRGF